MWRFLVAIAALSIGDVGAAQENVPRSFNQRLVEVVARSAPPDDKRAALARLGREARGYEEKAAVEAFRTMVDGWSKAETKALADAEAFAAANPRSGG
ncbi:MAG TPA: hypothetical protein VGR05_00615, partial [Sphingomicrobium sp.]|nr:hypothetical protein [Sphingomicrobium sp.]